jgi:pimeloyl-ACP methyl ester carboxylesterase
MSAPTHVTLSDLRGFHRLANDATVGLTDLVEAMHHTIVKVPGVLGDPPAGRTGGITGFVYRSVRGVTRLVGTGVDALLGTLGPLIAQRRSSQEREAVLAALNGVLGDYLAASGNPLAIRMQLRVGGTPLTLTRPMLAAAMPTAGRRIVVLAHGLCMNDGQWLRDGHDHGAALARDCGLTPVYLHYNSGRRVSENGREFGEMLEALVRAWPEPGARLTIVGHSMGGLVARSACHYSTLSGHSWPRRLDHLVFLGTPHLGAPLERAGAYADFLMGISPYSAPFARLGKVRSAGIKDLRHGNLRDEDLQAGARAHRAGLPLPQGVACYAIAASKQARSPNAGSRVRGDGLVPVASALGRHEDTLRDLGLAEDHCHVSYGTGHFGLLSNLQVYARIRDWLSDSMLSERPPRAAGSPSRAGR